MFLSNTAIILASGIWLSLLLGLLVFVLVALKSQKQVKEQDRIIGTLRTQVQRLATTEPNAGAGKEETEAPGDESLQSNEISVGEQLNAVSNEAFEELNIQHRALEQELASQAEALELAQQRIDTLDAALEQALEKEAQLGEENQRLERQVQTLTETMSVGDENIMKEIIVNFTEDSRQMLNTIDELEAEKSELQQFVADTKSSEKGTVGTVVGLKRKLSEARDEIAELKEECQRLLLEADRS